MGSSKSFNFGGVRKGNEGSAESNYGSSPDDNRLGGRRPNSAGELQYGQGPGKFALSVDADNNGYGVTKTHGGKKK